uniref:Protein fyv4, mitochondrial n=1 Tax=Talaromyces marneffei PM1 TaxID=1077442 RepID=A0A093VWL1_TALMA
MPAQKPSKKKPTSTTTKPEPTPRAPNWPPLRPLVPSTDLYIEPLLTEQIYIIRNFFTANLCKSYVSFLTSPSSAIDLITTPLKPKSRDHAVRVNDRFQVQDASFAELLWGATALKDVVCERRGVEEDEDDNDNDDDGREEEEKNTRIWGGTPLGLNPNIRIYRYTPGQFFAQHCKFPTNYCLLTISTIRS